MDVTNENFIQLLPEITKAIQECDFVAIDTELSGLLREKSQNKFELPEERFAKYVEYSKGYFIMQFGLSCFTCLNRTATTAAGCRDRYENKTFNFYIFPQPNKLYGDIDRTFSIQAHAIQFLSSLGFDFNKLFKHGISYLTFQEKKHVVARLQSEHEALSRVQFDQQGVPKFVPAPMRLFCRDWINEVKKFAEKSKAMDKTYSTTSTAVPRLEIRNCSSNHTRNVLKHAIESLPEAANLVVEIDTNEMNNESFLIVRYMDEQTKLEELKNNLKISSGFLKIIEPIIANKKPLVGHNLALDLIQIINQFIEPLNDDYDSFKETCHSLFPLIFDTKYIAHSILDPKTLTQNQSRLNDLYCQLRDSTDFPKIEVEHVGEWLESIQLPHQAGYDAYMSGFAFIVMCEAYIRQGSNQRCKQSKTDGIDLSPVYADRQIMEEFANKVHLSYSYDFKYFDLASNEREPNRAHVFYIEFPANWSLDDIYQVFGVFGGVDACRLNGTSALCALRDKRQINSVLKLIQDGFRSNFKIVTYDTYLETYKSKQTKTARCDMFGDVRA